MADIRIVPAAHRHINRLARDLRAIDRAECEAMGRTAKAALRHGILASAWARTALVDGEPQAMFGVVVENALTGVGVPWFLGTDAVYRHGRAMLARGPAILMRMGDLCPTLRNLVGADNARAIRMLRWWGFTIEPEPVIVRGMAFLRFSMEVR